MSKPVDGHFFHSFVLFRVVKHAMAISFRLGNSVVWGWDQKGGGATEARGFWRKNVRGHCSSSVLRNRERTIRPSHIFDKYIEEKSFLRHSVYCVPSVALDFLCKNRILRSTKVCRSGFQG